MTLTASSQEVRPPLESQDQWEFRGQNTRYGTHGMHTYVAAMIPQLARKLIEDYAPPKGIVFDPFCGGGAVPVEAVYSGRTAVGRDINELAVLISNAKTTYIDQVQANETANNIIDTLDFSSEAPLLDRTLGYWFKKEHLPSLDALRRSIEKNVECHSPLRTFFLAVFSATVRDVSLTYRNEIRLRRMTPSEIDNFNVDPIGRFQKRARQAAVVADDLPQGISTDIQIGDVQAISLGDDECSTIVCSPPYGDERNGVSYTQFSRNMLRWLGYSSGQIKKSKDKTLGWGKRIRTAPKSPTLEEALNAISEFPNSVNEAVSFYADYQSALAEMARVTRGHIVIVIGQRVLRDTIFDNGAITTDLMENIGVPLMDVFYRKLPSKRLPRMRKFGAAINREAILVFQK